MVLSLNFKIVVNSLMRLLMRLLTHYEFTGGAEYFVLLDDVFSLSMCDF